MAIWSLHIKSRGRCPPARPSHASPPAHVVVVRVQDFEYKLSQEHTLDTTTEQALYAGIRKHHSICAQLAAFEAAKRLQGQDWIRLSIFIRLGAFERNHPRFGCAHRTTDRPRCRPAVRVARAHGGPPCRRCRASCALRQPVRLQCNSHRPDARRRPRALRQPQPSHRVSAVCTRGCWTRSRQGVDRTATDSPAQA